MTSPEDTAAPAPPAEDTTPQEPVAKALDATSDASDEVLAVPLETTSDALAVLCAEPDARLQRRAIQILSTAYRKRPQVLQGMLEIIAAQGVPFRARWSVAEIYWGSVGKRRSEETEAALASLLPPGMHDIATRVLRSHWISRNQRPTGIDAPAANPRLDFHPLLEVDQHGYWPASQTGATESATLVDDEVDATLQALAQADFPISRELFGRHALLTVRSRERDGEPLPKEVISAAKKVLERVIADLRSWFSADAAGTEELQRLLVLPRLLGSDVDFWERLDKQRATLFELAPDRQDRAGHWATTVLCMHANSPAVTTALKGVPDAALMELLDGALRAEAFSLVGTIQDIALSRVRSDATSDVFWMRLGHIASTSPRLEQWWRNFIAPSAPKGLVALDEATETTLLLERVRRQPVSLLHGSELWDEVKRLGPRASLQVFAAAAARLLTAVGTAREDAIVAAIQHATSMTARIDTLRTDLLVSVGGVHHSVQQLMQLATDAQARLLHDLERVRVQRTAVDKPFVHVTPRAGTFDDPVQALLGLDRNMGEEEQQALMTRLHAHLMWLARENVSSLDRVAEVLDSLPPEALGLVCAVACSDRVASLLGAIAQHIGDSTAVERVWQATILRHSSSLASVPFENDQLNRISAELLKGPIRELLATHNLWSNGAALASHTAGADSALEELRAELRRLVERAGKIQQAF